MQNSRQKIDEIRASLEAELREMQTVLATNPSLSSKKTKDFDSDFDNRRYCIDSILTHIKGLSEITKNSAEYDTRISAINDCMAVYKHAKNNQFDRAFTQIRSIIFSDLDGTYKPKADDEPLQRSQSEPVRPGQRQSFSGDSPLQRSQSEPVKPQAAAGMRKFAMFKTAQAPAPSPAAKTLKCSVIALQNPPDQNNLAALQLKSNRAYIRCGNDLYYINKSRNTVRKLKDMNPDTLNKFDAATHPNAKAKLLSSAELNSIARIIGKKGHNAVKKAAPEKNKFSPK